MACFIVFLKQERCCLYFWFTKATIMKILIAVILTLFTMSLYAQDDVFDQKKSQIQKDQDIMNFIRSDIALYNHYKSGEKNKSAGKVLKNHHENDNSNNISHIFYVFMGSAGYKQWYRIGIFLLIYTYLHLII